MVLYCCADLIFATKIRSTAESLGVLTRPVRDLDMLQKRLDRVDDGKPNEPVTGLMIDLETGETGLQMIDRTKQHDPRIPVIAFGSHVAVDVLNAAREKGADQVLARSGFTAHLPVLLRSLAGKA